MAQRLFTLEEAQALLPDVRALAETLRERKRELDTQRGLLTSAGASAKTNGHGPSAALTADDAVRRAAEAIEAGIAQLASLGIEVKSIEDGLVDFPSERDGRVVYLCWRLGEPEIAYWHELDAGFRGRQPL